MLLFPSLKNQLFNSRYYILNNNIDELQNSKVFRNFQINVISIQDRPLESTYISRWTRFISIQLICGMNLKFQMIWKMPLN